MVEISTITTFALLQSFSFTKYHRYWSLMPRFLTRPAFIIVIICILGGSASGWFFHDHIPDTVKQWIDPAVWLRTKSVSISLPNLPFLNEKQSSKPATKTPSNARPSPTLTQKGRTNEPPSRIPSGKPQSDFGESVGFDTVRLQNKTLAVAGYAPAHSEVRLTINTTSIATVKTNRQGDFSYVGSIEAHKLIASNPDENILRLHIKPQSGTEFTSRAYVVLTSLGTAESGLSIKETKSGHVPTIAAVNDMRTLVLQSDRHKASNTFSIDVIDYDSRGNLYLGGVFKKPAEGAIIVYVNGTLVGSQRAAVAAESNIWEVHNYSEIPAGDVIVQVDLIVGRSVKSRRRIKFTKTKDVLLSPNFSKVIVRKGDTLWRIAEFVYGTGFRYILIFEGNHSQIADPSIIYPGQIFTLPKKKDSKS